MFGKIILKNYKITLNEGYIAINDKFSKLSFTKSGFINHINCEISIINANSNQFSNF